ncbi:L-serine ammonia-lyase [Consotaella salsifontis]|uniref:L-serine dehydratase n=1 Tax=Consotaella salsifontis TaxID=1365950 RepID=A0A1T4SHJ5_9HYPH|nr:L-serine ammonia-lyase [Consotaella salsifontis]SKA27774.1 L-serine dehydratase [Consotaella salsifontis]
MISVFDMFSIGIGPSSSHTVGPMRAARAFVEELRTRDLLPGTNRVGAECFGSLAQTGKGHATDRAIVLGLAGFEPDTVEIDAITEFLSTVEKSETIRLGGTHAARLPRQDGVVLSRRKPLAAHPNAMTFNAYADDNTVFSQTYYSIGGGFIVEDSQWDEFKRNRGSGEPEADVPYPFSTAAELLAHCQRTGLSISSLMLANEKCLRSHDEIIAGLERIWHTMQSCVERGCHTEGYLSFGVRRRAPALFRQLTSERKSNKDPLAVMEWIDLFALATSEENAAGGRIVTAPTNGAAGVIPAVLHYYDRFVSKVDSETLVRFFLTAAAIGILYKKNASISGAEVGCQGEIGVACSMAAGALAEICGGGPANVENAAEIGMEHNLGLTCDPIGGRVQVPCIERNAMGAVKAINAARLALRGTGEHRVSLDTVIRTMWETGKDMKTKYKETSRGGLAVNITEC